MTANISSGLASIGRHASSTAAKAAKASDVSAVKLKIGLKIKKKGKKV